LTAEFSKGLKQKLIKIKQFF